MLRIVLDRETSGFLGMSHKTQVLLLIITIAILLGIILGKGQEEKVISPLGDSPFIHKIFAAEPSWTKQTVREQVLLAGIRTFGSEHTAALDHLVEKESSFNPYAVNPTSGACGLFQALPCEKAKCILTNVSCQISWGMSYIKERYGNPTNAWNFWQQKSRESKSGRHGWY